MTPLIAAFVLLLLIFTAIGAVVRSIRQDHSANVRTVFYFYSLAFVVSSLVIIWAMKQGVFTELADHHGPNPPVLSKKAELVNSLRDSLEDIETDALVTGILVAVFALPQFLSYLLSGLFGCANAPWLIGKSMSFMLWTIVKFFAVFAGFGTAFSFFVAIDQIYNESALFDLIISSTSLFIAFLLLFFYRKTEDVIAWMCRNLPPTVTKMFRHIHKWATRHESKV